MRQGFLAGLCAFVLAIGVFCNTSASGMGLDPGFDQDVLGPERAIGVLVWSHGRSITAEDSESATPPFLRILREGGWDILRFDRPRDGDTLTDSTRRLVDYAARLKHQGYHRIVLASERDPALPAARTGQAGAGHAVLFPRRRFRSGRTRGALASDPFGAWAGLCCRRSAGLSRRPLGIVYRPVLTAFWGVHPRFCRCRRTQGRDGVPAGMG